MAKQWTHPKLGKFIGDAAGGGWRQEMNVPAFAAFSYDTGYSNARRSTGQITFTLSAWLADDDLPTPTRASPWKTKKDQSRKMPPNPFK